MTTEQTPRATVEHRGLRGFVLVDYFIIDPHSDAKLYPPDSMGKPIAAWVAGLFDWATEDDPNPPSRCSTCAFRKGTVANNSGRTTTDALECIASGRTFYCHEGVRTLSDEAVTPCAGFTAVNDSRVGEWLRHLRATGQLASMED